VLVLVMVGLPDLFNAEDQLPQIIPVDIVQIDQRTTVKPPKPKPEEKPKPKPEPPKRAPEPQAKPDAVPLPPEITDLPKRRPKPELLKPQPQLAEVPVNVRPRAKPRPPSRFDASRIAALLDKSKKKDAAPAQPQQQSIDTARLTASLQDAIRAQVQPCWLFPAGAPHAEDLDVRLHISLNPDGSLNGPPVILNQGKVNQSDYYRVAAESARRAVQKCAPLKLPVDSYDLWRDIDMNFNPKDMITG
jgi:colicin import membrane protein